jgi:hypothetical protein
VAGQITKPTVLARLGKYKLGKGYLYIGKLSEINIKVLEQLVKAAVEAKVG